MSGDNDWQGKMQIPLTISEWKLRLNKNAFSRNDAEMIEFIIEWININTVEMIVISFDIAQYRSRAKIYIMCVYNFICSRVHMCIFIFMQHIPFFASSIEKTESLASFSHLTKESEAAEE